MRSGVQVEGWQQRHVLTCEAQRLVVQVREVCGLYSGVSPPLYGEHLVPMTEVMTVEA